MTQENASSAVAALLRGRRTVHDFTDEKPPQDLIVQAVELARWAPNHHRTEPWRFYLLSERVAEKVVDLNTQILREKNNQKVAEIKRKRWLAMPGWLVVSCKKSDDPITQREDYAACCCAAHNLALFLWSHDIGMKWTTGDITRRREFFSIIGASHEQEFVVGMFWYGYPASIPDQRRKEVETILRIVDG